MEMIWGGYHGNWHSVTNKRQYDMGFCKAGDAKKYGAFNRERVLSLFGISGWVRQTYPRISVSMQDYGVNPSLSWMDVIYPVNWIELVAAQTSHWIYVSNINSWFAWFACIACSCRSYAHGLPVRPSLCGQISKNLRLLGIPALSEQSPSERLEIWILQGISNEV